jgi:hypothetical protein
MKEVKNRKEVTIEVEAAKEVKERRRKLAGGSDSMK